MKKIFNPILIIAAAAAILPSCNKNLEQAEPVPAEGRTINFTANVNGTKTAFTAPDGTNYPTVWTENDSKVKVSVNLVNHADNTADVTVTPSEDGTTASFSATLNPAEATGYKIFAISPSSACIGVSALKTVQLDVPATQTPSALSPDESAQILYAESESLETIPGSVSLSFNHWTAYGKLTLKNLDLDDAAVSSISLTSTAPLAGRWYKYFYAADSYSAGQSVVNSGINTITIKTSSVENVWFACAPVDLSSTVLTVVVGTDKGTFTKDINIPADKRMESGKIAKFSVNMAGIELVAPKVYSKVTDIASLTDNSKVIIASDDALTSTGAISTTQNTNNRAVAGIVKNNSGQVVDPVASVEVFTVSKSSGKYAFQGKDGKYICAESGKNYLKSTTTKADGLWNVEISSTSTSISQFDGTNARYLRYNETLFGAYASTSTVKNPVAIYKLEGSGDAPSTKDDPNLTVPAKLDATVGAQTEIGATTSSDGTITYQSSDAEIATVSTTGVVTGVKAGTCKITVSVAQTDDYESATEEIAVTVYTAPMTIAEVHALAVGNLNTSGASDIASYLSLGEVSVMGKASSNVIVKDNTGVLLVYGSNTFNAGDVIKVKGTLKNYYGVAEFVMSSSEKVTGGTAITAHGDPLELDEAAITSYSAAPYVTYASVTGVLPSDGKMIVGTKTVKLNNSIPSTDQGKTATVKGYAIGYNNSSKQLTFVNLSYEAEQSEPIIVIDGSVLTTTATTEETTQKIGSCTILFGKGVKYQTSTNATKYFGTQKSIILPPEISIHNTDATPGKIVKFEIYANYGASTSAKVSVAFSSTAFTEEPSSFAQELALSTVDSVFECDSKAIPDGAKYFWLKNTGTKNSQLQIRITYDK